MTTRPSAPAVDARDIPDPQRRRAAARRSALTLALAVFVGFTSIFVAVLAFVVPSFASDTVGLSGDPHLPRPNDGRLAVIAGALSLINGAAALGRGRRNLVVSIATTSIFAVLTAGTTALFIRTW